MAKETIYINLVSGSKPPKLHLSDSEGHSGDGNLTTNVKPGDKVIWEIVVGCGISSISISRKRASEDVFSKDPRAKPDGSWTGTVSTNAAGQESYGIKYMVDGVQYDDDPIIKVKQ